MTIPPPTPRRRMTKEEWWALSLYEKFEHAVIFLLSGIIAVIIVVSLWVLIREVFTRLVLSAFDPLNYATFQAVFGMIFTVVIALEFKRSLLVATAQRFGCIQVRTIVIIALLAIARKFIIIDLGQAAPAKIAALAGAALALGIVYWLVREQDQREWEATRQAEQRQQAEKTAPLKDWQGGKRRQEQSAV